MVTYFVVLGFQQGKKGMLIPDDPREIHGGKERCISAARRLMKGRVGVVAFSRSGDPNLGDWSDAEVLFQDGVVPEDVFAMN